MVDTIGLAARITGGPTRALAGVEALRAIRHPLFVLGALIAAVATFRPWVDGSPPSQDWQNQTQFELNVAWTTLYIGAFLVGHAIAGRGRASSIKDLLRAAPVDDAGRTRAVLLAGLAPAGIALSLGLVYSQLIARAGGFYVGTTISGYDSELSIADTLSPAVVTLAAYVAGVALASRTTSRSVALLTAALFWLVVLMPYWLWVYPWFQLVAPHGTAVVMVPVDSADQARAQGFPGVYYDAALGWFGLAESPWLGLVHLVYVLGVALCFATVALRLAGAKPRRLAAAGIGAVVAGVVAQLLVQGLVTGAYPRS